MKKIYFCITPVVVILFLQGASAQRNEKKPSITPWEVGLSGGVSVFLASVNPGATGTSNRNNFWNNDLNPGAGLSVTRNFSPFWGLELNWLNTRLSGRWKEGLPVPGIFAEHGIPLTYDTRINEFDLMIAFNINQTLIPDVEEDNWHIFVKPGVGFAHIIDTKKFYPDGSSYNRPSFVFDAGLSVSLNAKIKLIFGSTFRLVNTDNLDGIHESSTYLYTSTANFKRGYEIYNFNYLRLSYCFGNRIERGRFGLGF